MSAYNRIIIHTTCPNCGQASEIKCQTHVSSSYDGIGERFNGKTYGINDTMLWYDKQHPLYKNWRQGNCKTIQNDDEETECCYSECLRCWKECYVIIKFKNCTIVDFELPGKIENWPNGFYK